ncbi:MAG: DegV family EDD domain-containing protein [Lachnospiraceae bacterium]|nr:DegV family EDD domain-containing protein [Lachnospiraceae bacterium]
MKRKSSGSEQLPEGIELIILTAFTITGLILIAEILTVGWEKVVVPVVICLLVYSWVLGLLRRHSSVQRVWLYAIFIMFCYFFYGVHQTRMDVLPLAAVVIILVFFITGLPGLLWMSVFTYYFTTLFNLASAQGEWREVYGLSMPLLLLQFFLVLLSGAVAHFFTTERIREKERLLEKERDTLRVTDYFVEQTRVAVKEIGKLSHDMEGELLLLRDGMREDFPDGKMPVEMQSLFDISQNFETKMTDMQDYYDLLSGKIKLRDEVYEIVDLLAQLRMEFADRDYVNAPKLIIDLDPLTPTSMAGDSVKIRGILRQLITNSMTYTRSGGVRVKIATHFHMDECNLYIKVDDTGMGIEQTDLERLLEGIENHRSSAYRPGGMGLGLCLVGGFVRCMGGFFRIESEPGKGTGVCVSIPQRVVDAVPCMSFDARDDICLAFEDRRYADGILNDYYEELFLNTCDKLNIPGYFVQNEKELRELISAHRKVCLFIKPEWYEENPTYYDALSDVYISVFATPDYEIPEGSNLHLFGNPIGSYELLRVVEKAKKTIDRRRRDDSEKEEAAIGAEELHKRDVRLHGNRKVMIVTDSMADLPAEMFVSRYIPVIPFHVYTAEGSFLDETEISQACALTYFKSQKDMYSKAPEEEDFREFFEENLRYASHIIYISTSRKISASYEHAKAAAKDMGHVFVFNSGQVSGGVGLMAVMADEQAHMGKQPEEIMEYLEKLRPKIRTSFLIDNLDRLAEVGRVSKGIAAFGRIFMVHPEVVVKHGMMTIGNIHFGSIKEARTAYIRRIIKRRARIDHTRIFVGLIGIPAQEVIGLEQQLEMEGEFQNVFVRRSSASISINCGAGTFGMIYVEK